MGKKRRSVQETTAAVVEETVAVEDEQTSANLRANLEEISKYDGVIGYILRNTTSATIDVKDPTKIVDYAVLSSSAFEAGKEFSELFDLDKIENILIEGNDVKVISLSLGDNKVSVFMEKKANHDKVLRKLQI